MAANYGEIEGTVLLMLVNPSDPANGSFLRQFRHDELRRVPLDTWPDKSKSIQLVLASDYYDWLATQKDSSDADYILEE